tara:strand:- start:1269 stop:1547 length:279 start_codon:yes stop_codon:yes gene_type:complete
MPKKEWTRKEIAKIKTMKKTMTASQIAKKKGLRVSQVNYALYKEPSKIFKPVFVEESLDIPEIKTMAEVRGRLKKREEPKTFWERILSCFRG